MYLWPIFIPIVLAVLFVFWILKGGGKRLADEVSKIKSCLHYIDNVQLQIIKIQQRDPCLKKAFAVEADKTINVAYRPDQYIFTSATVGGVTTGGVSKIDGGYNINLGEKTGSYSLKCYYCPKGGMYDSANPQNNWAYINCISLSQEDYLLAKGNPKLANYLNETAKSEFEKAWKKTIPETALYLPHGNCKASELEYLIDWLACKE